MKKSTYLLLVLILFYLKGFTQANQYNLVSNNLHKKVKKTINHHYTYDKNSGGFVKKSVTIKNYNKDGNLIETYSLYNSIYSKKTEPVKKKYHYNNNKQLTFIEDISNKRGKYSSNKTFIYDKKGNLSLKKLSYLDDDKPYTKYFYDKNNRLIKIENYTKDHKLSSKTQINHKGKNRTETKMGFSSKDGSIYGTYTTYYKGRFKINYISESKYGNTKYTYVYDKFGNLKKSLGKGKKNYLTEYNYAYDKKNNWIKKHEKTGNSDNFYFREIIFRNNDISGNTDFDKSFINIYGNFDNVNVVPLKKKSLYKNKTTTNVNNTNNATNFRYKNWVFTYINIKEKAQKISGKIELTVKNNNSMNIGATIELMILLNGKKATYGDYKITNYTDKGELHIWELLSSTSNLVSKLYVYKKPKKIKGLYIKGLLDLGSETENSLSFYLE